MNIFKTKKQLLKDCDLKNTPNFFPQNGTCKVLKVSDGDTLVICTVLNKTPQKFPVRLYGIDAPELHSKNPEEVAKAIHAKTRLEQLIAQDKNNFTYVKFVPKKEKFGRYLVEVYRDSKCGVSYNDVLVSEKLALKYDGGKKVEYDESNY